MADILLENDLFRLTVGEDCIARSLVIKENGEECLQADEGIALFSVTQDRPYNNEVKLSHPNKRTTWQAKSLRREGDRLYVSFETVPVKAVIRVREAPEYILFRLEGFEVLPEDYNGLCMNLPPVAELRLCQLPVKHRARFGEWLNVVWDERAAVDLLALSPHARIDQERRGRCRVLAADAVRGIRLVGCEAALIACTPERFLDAMDRLEEDNGLPRGARSRRGPMINASVYWTSDISPANADEHIAWAKKGGFRLMLIYYTAFFREKDGYSLCGNYDYNDNYPGGRTDVEALLRRVKAAGIEPGLHFLQTHIGLQSRYVTPRADPRLGKKRRFTLERPFREGDGELYVLEDPEGSELHPGCRLLQFGGELISYEGYTSDPPYRFTGARRGACGTLGEDHPAGQVGSLLDVSEYGASSCYIDQNTDLQDEIAEKIADVYNAGFRFCYMDGSEGASPPYEYHVPNAQYRVYKRLNPPPLFTEGAAKAHFSWHFQAGGNAFDIFPPPRFKEMIARYPAEEAPRMRQDFTRLDFGWWGFWAPRAEDDGIQADMYEYGESRSAAWDCPASVQANLAQFRAHPRAEDIFEVLRRWEDARARGWLTDERREALKDLGQEHTLLVDENGEYELAPWRPIKAPDGISAFLIGRPGASCVAYWHRTGSARLRLPLPQGSFSLRRELNGPAEPAEADGEWSVIPADGRRYLQPGSDNWALEKAFASAQIID